MDRHVSIDIAVTQPARSLELALSDLARAAEAHFNALLPLAGVEFTMNATAGGPIEFAVELHGERTVLTATHFIFAVSRLKNHQLKAFCGRHKAKDTKAPPTRRDFKALRGCIRAALHWAPDPLKAALTNLELAVTVMLRVDNSEPADHAEFARRVIIFARIEVALLRPVDSFTFPNASSRLEEAVEAIDRATKHLQAERHLKRLQAKLRAAQSASSNSLAALIAA